jgi:pyridoxamine 5'-phosphate oxidase
MTSNIETIRRDYSSHELTDAITTKDPTSVLASWLDQALNSEEKDANAMALATMSGDGYPTSRIVLARGLTGRTIQFFTNYNSHKGLEMDQNPKVGLTFFWPTLERQVRIFGLASKLSTAGSDHYFASRPRESQIGAWASPQSKPIKDRSELEKLYQDQVTKFQTAVSVPRPGHWGGYQVSIEKIEFWQGRPSRLHDRFLASYDGLRWTWSRLAP